MNNFLAIGLEAAVVLAGLALLLLDLWTPPAQKRSLGYAAAIAVGAVFLASFAIVLARPVPAFNGMIVLDDFALFFHRFFLLAAVLVLVMSVEFADRFENGVAEYYALTLFALAGMMFAASANDFALLFVALELITVTFYVLTSFERRRTASLEAGVKYLILGALSSAFLVYGIALVYGVVGTMNFARIAEGAPVWLDSPLLQAGLLLVFVGLGFKIAVVPFQIWAPDFYQGSPTPTTAFLAVGSKAAGFVLLLRVLFLGVPALGQRWQRLFIVLAALTILYGVLCAIPQRNLKRLLGYSSIANAGFLLLGVATLGREGVSAILYYLAGYLFSVLGAFAVICVALRHTNRDQDDLTSLAGLHERSPLLAATLALAMVSLAGVPPLAGFVGKFLLLKAALTAAAAEPWLYVLTGVAVIGVVISLYYYFRVIRAMYWPAETAAQPASEAIEVSRPMRWALGFCIVGMLWLGVLPDQLLTLTNFAAQSLAP